MPHYREKVDEGCSRRARLDGEGGGPVGWRERQRERERERNG